MRSEALARLATLASRALFWATIAAVLGAAPAALRLALSGRPFFLFWCALSGVLVAPSAALVLTFSLARRGFRELARGNWLIACSGVALWLALFVPTAALFGAFLKRFTHHHGLAGATYGAALLVLALVTSTLAYRATAIITRWRAASPALGNALLFVCWGAFAGVVAAVVATVGAAEGGPFASPLSPKGQVAMVDALVWVFAVGVGASARVPSRVGRAYGLGAVSVAAACGAAACFGALPRAEPLGEGAPLLAFLAEAVAQD